MNIFSQLQSWGQWLTSDPVGFIVYLLYTVGTVLLALTIHEFAHAYAAYRCGDPTAKMMGRMTLNPIKHIDPIGTVMLFLFRFGYAKPVPVNPRNYRNFRRDDIIVSLAGIAVNLLACVVCLTLAYFVNRYLWSPDFHVSPEVRMIFGNGIRKIDMISSTSIGGLLVYGHGPQFGNINGVMQFFQSQMANPWLQYVQRFLLQFAWLNLGLAIFNLLPIPPLDGFHVFNDILFKGRLRLSPQALQMAMVVMMVLMATGTLSEGLGVVRQHAENGILWFISALAGGA